MNAVELTDDLLLRYLDRATSAEEEAFVAARLQLDASARRHYVRLSHLHALVAEVVREPASTASPWRSRALWSVAAALAVAALLALPIGAHRVRGERASVPPAAAVTVSACHGQVTIVHGLQRGLAAQGSAIAAGDEVQLGAGADAALDWHDGAALALVGGTRLRMGDASTPAGTLACELLSGAISARISHRQRPFTVRAGSATVSDLGTEFTVAHAEAGDVLVDVEEGSVLLASGGGEVTVRSGRGAAALAQGRPYLAALTPAPPVGISAWRDPSYGCACDARPFAIDSRAWHAEPLGSCSVPAEEGNGLVVVDHAGTMLGRVPVPDLTGAGAALAGLETLEVTGAGRSWCLRGPTLRPTGTLEVRALDQDVARGAPPALGGLFGAADLEPAAPGHGLAIALPQNTLDAHGLAIGARLRPARADEVPQDGLPQALARCAQRGLVVVATAARPTLFYDRRMPAALRPHLGEAMRALIEGGLERLIVPETPPPGEASRARIPVPGR